MFKNNFLVKIIVSGLLAFVVLNVIMFFYYNVPIHKANNNGSTDYTWESNSLYVRADEGIGFGMTNNEGYMNVNDYDGNIDILLVGSSHMEDQNIPLSKNISTLLNKYIDKYETYNIGISGHSFKVIVNNLDDALNTYKPKYVVLEASNIVFSDDYINNILVGNVEEIESSNNKLILLLEKIPLFRIGYAQIEKLYKGNDFVIDEANSEKTLYEFNEDLNDKLLKYIKEIANKYDTEVIIMYHPSVAINSKGEMVIATKEVSNKFNDLCLKNNIYYLDMSETFINEYDKKKIVPTGFINGPIATGHLNVDGHRMIAEELSKLIQEIDK